MPATTRTTTRTTTPILGALCLAAILGCPSGDSGTVTESMAASRLADEACAFYFSCDCDDYGYPDEAFCRESLSTQTHAYLEDGRRAGLTFDGDCFQESLESWADEECISDPFEWPEATECSYCDYYYGTVAAGEPCAQYGDFSDCARGLYCDDGTCSDPCAQAGEGESCVSAGGNVHDCAPGLSCSSETEVCVRLAQVGESCESSACADELWCGLESICVVLPSLGEACGYACKEGLTCSDQSVCTERPGAGQPCPQGECAEGAYCDYGEDPNDADPSPGADPSLDAEWICRAYGAEGAPCAGDNGCLSYDCRGGVCSAQESWVCE